MESKITELSIVLIGDFNPIVFQPSWLVYKGLIQEVEAEEKNITEVLIHPEISKFSLDWADIEITKQRFQIKTTKASHFEVIKDLAISIFKILKNTPLNKIGINHSFHYQLTPKKYYELGEKLAPFNNWDNVLKKPKLLHLEMQEFPREDGAKGYYRINVIPSNLIPDSGINITTNNHFENSIDKNVDNEEIINILINNWIPSNQRAKNILTQLWENLKL